MRRLLLALLLLGAVIATLVAFWPREAETVDLESGIAIRPLTREVTASAAGELVVHGADRSTLEILARRPLEAVILGFDRRAPVQIEVTGGRLGERILHPDGSIDFEVLLDEGEREEGEGGGRFLYRLEIALPGAPNEAMTVQLTPRERRRSQS